MDSKSKSGDGDVVRGENDTSGGIGGGGVDGRQEGKKDAGSGSGEEEGRPLMVMPLVNPA